MKSLKLHLIFSIFKNSITLQDLYADYERYGKWGLICAFQWLPLMLSNIERSTVLSKDIDISKSRNTVLQQRLCGLIDFYYSREYLK